MSCFPCDSILCKYVVPSIFEEHRRTEASSSFGLSPCLLSLHVIPDCLIDAEVGPLSGTHHLLQDCFAQDSFRDSACIFGIVLLNEYVTHVITWWMNQTQRAQTIWMVHALWAINLMPKSNFTPQSSQACDIYSDIHCKLINLFSKTKRLCRPANLSSFPPDTVRNTHKFGHDI